MSPFHRHATLAVTAFAFTGIVLYESVMAATDQPSIGSVLTAQWARGHTASVLVFGIGLGILLGHLFWWHPAPQGRGDLK